MEEVGKICLTGGRVDDSLDRDAEKGQSENESKRPKDEFKYGHG